MIPQKAREQRSTYRGTLEVDATRRDGGLPVELVLNGRTLTVSSGGEILGSYPIVDIDVARVGSDRFDLRIGSDELVFTADDAIRFSYEAMPMIASVRADRTHRAVDRVRSWLQARGETSEQPAPAGQGPPDVSPAGRAFTPNNGPSLSELRRRLGVPDRVEDDRVEDDRVEDDRASTSTLVAGPPSPGRSMTPLDLTVDPPTGPASDPTCIGVRSDGMVCGSAAVSERGFCFAHDPERHVERREVREKSSQAAARVRRSSADNLGDVVARLERAVAEVHEGRLDPQRALAMASLAQAMVETIELAKSEEAGRREA